MLINQSAKVISREYVLVLQYTNLNASTAIIGKPVLRDFCKRGDFISIFVRIDAEGDSAVQEATWRW